MEINPLRSSRSRALLLEWSGEPKARATFLYYLVTPGPWLTQNNNGHLFIIDYHKSWAKFWALTLCVSVACVGVHACVCVGGCACDQ